MTSDGLIVCVYNASPYAGILPAVLYSRAHLNWHGAIVIAAVLTFCIYSTTRTSAPNTSSSRTRVCAGAVAAAQKRQRDDAAGGMLPPGSGSRDPTPQPHGGSGRQAPARQASRGADALPGLEAGVARGHDRQQENNQGQDHGRSRGRDEEGVHDRDKGKSDRAKLDRRETDGRLEEKSGRAADRSDKSDKRDKDRPAKPERERERRDRDDAGKVS